MIEALVFVAGVLLGAGVVVVARRRPAAAAAAPRSARRILFPFLGQSLSESALDAALRIARAEDATLVPVYLAEVPMQLHFDAPLPRTCDGAFSMFEAIEQRAAGSHVPVDSRIIRGRNARHALRGAVAEERFDRLVVAAGPDGFSADDVAWLLSNAPGEIVVLRPDVPATGRGPRPRWTTAQPRRAPARSRARAAA